jgi:carbonic anhydrase/acetyltransferase-like protein (isoleucine patch superfamily)
MNKKPNIHPSAFIADGAQIWGDVTIGENSSVWFNAVLRGDEGPIAIGSNTNIQDCCVLHSDLGQGVEIGDWVTLGHGVVVRGAKIGNNTMIGMNCTIMSGAVIPEHCVVGAHSFVPYNERYPPRTLIYGTPAKAVRELAETETQFSRVACGVYLKLMEDYRSGRISRG